MNPHDHIHGGFLQSSTSSPCYSLSCACPGSLVVSHGVASATAIRRYPCSHAVRAWRLVTYRSLVVLPGHMNKWRGPSSGAEHMLQVPCMEGILEWDIAFKGAPASNRSCTAAAFMSDIAREALKFARMPLFILKKDVVVLARKDVARSASLPAERMCRGYYTR